MEETEPLPKLEAQNLPKVLILNPPTVFRLFEEKFSQHFNFIKAYNSPLSIPEFLSTSNATDVTAMLASAAGPSITGRDILDYLPSLRCIVTASAGVDHIDIAECHCRGIAVANAADVFSGDCAETALSLLIAVFRKICAGDRYVRSGSWKSSTEDYPLGLQFMMHDK
ncbi:hypothetical protein BVRB_011550 [Beta vulgaris subsp. vulgaris]|uniref:D-isomer specific 2-hydroxyacid dehydrogenase catalytic domain-containing protein n=1 Tax=Beta vulgaris subsp. vulgaris TaxID=3555 RepID=A0A0J8B5U7_BETVV|nr:hypothetical protein BVRB_011550 [Beta vulgaris subsp. vulgaris]